MSDNLPSIMDDPVHNFGVSRVLVKTRRREKQAREAWRDTVYIYSEIGIDPEKNNDLQVHAMNRRLKRRSATLLSIP